MILNKSSVDRGMFHGLIYQVFFGQYYDATINSLSSLLLKMPPVKVPYKCMHYALLFVNLF